MKVRKRARSQERGLNVLTLGNRAEALISTWTHKSQESTQLKIVKNLAACFQIMSCLLRMQIILERIPAKRFRDTTCQLRLTKSV